MYVGFKVSVPRKTRYETSCHGIPENLDGGNPEIVKHV
jgi:hypothetical protein